MATNKDMILWLDLETTGSDSSSDIIEIGMVLTKQNPHLDIIDSFRKTVRPRDMNKLLDMSSEVVRMHTDNGLIEELLLGKGTDLWQVSSQISNWLWGHTKSVARIPLAGSGVSHFDRQFIRRDMQALDAWLTYWAYDVGVMRRMLRLAGHPIPDKPVKPLTHRALDDVYDHITEARIYLGWLADLPKERP